jgi:choline dehydrogenase-like flavoprotein
MMTVESSPGIVVIGSGPSGVAATHALTDAGHRVTLLDAGDKIETGRMEVFDALAEMEPESWPPELAERARGAFPVDIRHIPLKPAYGSLFPYAREDVDLPVTCDRAETTPSLAYGGLSNCWGAAMLPFRQRDIADWPISLAELEEHYEAVLRFVPIAAECDELAETFPLYTESPDMLRRGLQAEMVLGHLRRHSGALRRAGFSFGASRLAVVGAAENARTCRHSGMCLYGCPYGAIYNSTQTLEELERRGRIDYRGGIYVERLTEGDDGVTIDFHRRGDGTEVGQLVASRVFVACGAISSTRLMMDSMDCVRFRLRLQDSQYFIVPMLAPRAVHVGVANQGNTLAQVFLEVEDRRIAEHAMHLQLYGYNDLMLAALAGRLPIESKKLEYLLRPLLGRMIVAQGYFHSAESPGLTFRRDRNGACLVGDDPSMGVGRAKKLLRHLAAHGRALGMCPIPPLAQFGHPGKSNHVGGSLPMRIRPGELETDTLGRLPSWCRVHVVDAAILPSVPATTVTVSVMANAHRIATAAAGMVG